MSARTDLLIRNAEVGGLSGQDVRIKGGRVAEIGPRLPRGGEEIDARGGALIRGLVDHHIHLLATAARAASLNVEQVSTPSQFAERLRAFAADAPPHAWVRVMGYHERIAGLLTRWDLDRLVSDRPVRVQHQTGSLWVLNSRALAIVDRGEPPEALERDAAGVATGRIWRGDVWLSQQVGRTPPPLAPIGAALAARGVTAVMDASATTDADTGRLLADAHCAGALPQHLGLMSFGPLPTPGDGAFVVGPRKILLDDHNLPSFEECVRWIAEARTWKRPVAVHCVAAGELALALAAFEAAGAAPGDRIEHGGVISAEAIPVVRRLGLTVVTQPGFVFERGDRYIAEVAADEQQDLYRCASLLAAQVPVAFSSDAPYSAPDPWAVMRAAVRRRTREGQSLGAGERVTAAEALALHSGDLAAPGRRSPPIAAGDVADLCLLKLPLGAALDQLDAGLVATTFIGGRPAYRDLEVC
jgi:predicted amidohydrolase YtcJ